MRFQHIASWILVNGLALACGTVWAQSYPSKTIHIFAPEAGGGGDLGARLIAQALTGALGQPVVVDNRPSGFVLGQTAAKAPPDGYTLLYTGGSIWILPLLQNAPYDPVKDLSPIALAARSPNVLVVHPSLPVKSVNDLIALAKAKPGVINYASGSSGAGNHLSAELFKSMADINIVRIAYKGETPGINALISGQVQVMFPVAKQVAPHVQSGRLRALAVTSAQRSTLVPDLPTMAASGLPGYESITTYAIFAPSGTPPAIINLLNQEIVRGLQTPDIKNKLSNAGIEGVGSSPDALAVAMKSEMSRMGRVIKEANIRAE